jgi:hypothetical protein
VRDSRIRQFVVCPGQRLQVDRRYLIAQVAGQVGLSQDQPDLGGGLPRPDRTYRDSAAIVRIYFFQSYYVPLDGASLMCAAR